MTKNNSSGQTIKCDKCGKSIRKGIDWWVSNVIPITINNNFTTIYEDWCWDCHKKEETKEWERHNSSSTIKTDVVMESQLGVEVFDKEDNE